MNIRHAIIAGSALVLCGILMRFAPHLPNMTPIAAIAFAGSMYLRTWWTIFFPLVALFLSDALIGFYDWHIMLSVYGSFLIVGIISRLKRESCDPLVVATKIGSGSLVFFLITNAAVWAYSPWYEKSIAGLLYAYELGLPFFRNMLLGDFIYTVAFIAMFESFRFYIVARAFHKITTTPLVLHASPDLQSSGLPRAGTVVGQALLSYFHSFYCSNLRF